MDRSDVDASFPGNRFAIGCARLPLIVLQHDMLLFWGLSTLYTSWARHFTLLIFASSFLAPKLEQEHQAARASKTHIRKDPNRHIGASAPPSDDETGRRSVEPRCSRTYCGATCGHSHRNLVCDAPPTHLMVPYAAASLGRKLFLIRCSVCAGS